VPRPPDQTGFRYTLGHFPAGVTVMTTCLGERLHGMTVSAFCSVSLEPLLVLVCVEKVTHMHQLVEQSRVFAVNVLGARDEAASRFFADDARLRGPEFIPGSYRAGVTGCPILNQASAYVEARVRQSYDGGDHTIFLGEVVALDVLSENPPLVFYRGGYTTLK
jgi:flavin reductase (DIM6/NTAB) family NADH-FMN oxidoreductase RutF